SSALYFSSHRVHDECIGRTHCPRSVPTCVQARVQDHNRHVRWLDTESDPCLKKRLRAGLGATFCGTNYSVVRDVARRRGADVAPACIQSLRNEAGSISNRLSQRWTCFRSRLMERAPAVTLPA